MRLKRLWHLGKTRLLSDAQLYRWYRLRHASHVTPWLNSSVFHLHVPKCAGASICSAMGIKDPGHMLFSDYSLDVQDTLAKKPMFVVARDPVSRIVSVFNHALFARERVVNSYIEDFAKYGDINTFIDKRLNSKSVSQHYFLRPSSTFVAAAEASGATVTILPFANLRTCVPEFLSAHGINISELPHHNAGKKIATVEQIHESHREKINSLYAADLELLQRAL